MPKKSMSMWAGAVIKFDFFILQIRNTVVWGTCKTWLGRSKCFLLNESIHQPHVSWKQASKLRYPVSTLKNRVPKFQNIHILNKNIVVCRTHRWGGCMKQVVFLVFLDPKAPFPTVADKNFQNQHTLMHNSKFYCWKCWPRLELDLYINDLSKCFKVRI